MSEASGKNSDKAYVLNKMEEAYKEKKKSLIEPISFSVNKSLNVYLSVSHLHRIQY